MILPDVNILIYAYRQDATDHKLYRIWLEHAFAGDEPIGLADAVLNSVVRITTHPRIFRPPSPIEDALGFIEDLLDSTNAGLAFMGGVELQPVPRLRVYGEARYTLASDIRYPGIRIGAALMLPGQPAAQTSVGGAR